MQTNYNLQKWHMRRSVVIVINNNLFLDFFIFFLFLGFVISVVALLGFKNVTMTSLIVPLLLIAIPILDTLFAIIRRTIKIKSL